MKRKYCAVCSRPTSVCFCSDIVTQDNDVRVTILRHADEINHPLGTATMAKLSFTKSVIIEQGMKQDLKLSSKTVLLYPSEGSVELTPSMEIDHLIVLDGTWRKAKRLLNEFTELNKIPRVHLPSSYQSLYTIRKAPEKHMLSTLEAITHSLSLIEKRDFTASLQVLEKQIKKHIEYMGEEKFNLFYKA